jgi:hypothetical protein
LGVEQDYANLNQGRRQTFALLSKLLELLDQSARHLSRLLDDGIGSRSESRVDLGGPVDHVGDDRVGVLEERGDSLISALIQRVSGWD